MLSSGIVTPEDSRTEPAAYHDASSANPDPIYLTQADLHWVASRMYLQRAQIEAVATGLETVQQTLSMLCTRVAILESRLSDMRRRSHNKCTVARSTESSFLYTLDD